MAHCVGKIQATPPLTSLRSCLETSIRRLCLQNDTALQALSLRACTPLIGAGLTRFAAAVRLKAAVWQIEDLSTCTTRGLDGRSLHERERPRDIGVLT
jgi:hypothetical protein